MSVRGFLAAVGARQVTSEQFSYLPGPLLAAVVGDFGRDIGGLCDRLAPAKLDGDGQGARAVAADLRQAEALFTAAEGALAAQEGRQARPCASEARLALALENEKARRGHVERHKAILLSVADYLERRAEWLTTPQTPISRPPQLAEYEQISRESAALVRVGQRVNMGWEVVENRPNDPAAHLAQAGRLRQAASALA